MNALARVAKYLYDHYPFLIKRLGFLELATLPPYRLLYLKRIEKKSEEFLRGGVTIEFEVTNKCNADCIMCPNGVMERRHERMDMDFFKKIADEIADEKLPLIKFVFAGLGEPTLDPLLTEKIRYLKKRMPHVPVQVTTNASLLNETRSRELIASGLDLMTVSFNGTTKASYEAVMGSLSFDRTLENLLRFLEMRKDLKPKVTLSCVRLDANAKDFPGLENFWRMKGVKVEGYKTPVPFNRGGEQMRARYTSRWALPEPTAKRHLYPCRMMGENLLIHPSGSVVLCFADYEEKHVMGRLGEDSLKQILRTKRQWFERHRRADFSHTPLCQNCSFMREQVVSWWQDSYF